MRNLKRNTQKIFYALYSEDSGVDKWGNTIGGYTEPVAIYMSLSADSSDTENEVFGKNLTYDRQIVTSDMSCPIDEYSRLWIGIPTTESHNYIVVRVATTMRQKRYAIKRVIVDENNNNSIKG